MKIRSKSPVALIGARPVSMQEIEEILPDEPFFVAADGGAAQILRAGHVPDAVIGDFDSLPQFAREQIPADRLHHVSEQDSTDFEKCLRGIVAPLILAFGFTGGRIDHELAVYSALARYREKPAIVIGSDDIVFRLPPRLRMPLDVGTRVSLFPMGPVAGRSSGLRWPIDGIAFAPDGRVGTSNITTGPVDIACDDGPMLVIMPRAVLGHVMRALHPG